MLILGIETSGVRGGVALCRDEEVLGSRRFPEGARHERNIMTAVGEVILDAGVGRRDIGAVAVSEGPGSFTGVRVGVTCAKVLAYLLGCPAVGVPSLEVMVQNVDAERCGSSTACPLRDARRSFVYGTVFRWEGSEWKDLTGVLTGHPEEVAACIPRPALVFGSGVEAYPDVFLPSGQSEQGSALVRGPVSLAEGEAGHVARLGLRRLRAGDAVDPFQLAARYYRRTEAEEKVLRGAPAAPSEPGR